MIEIHYAPGQAVSDFELEQVYRDLLTRLRKGNITATYSTENIFLRIRVGIFQGDIAHTNVVFRFQDHKMRPDKDGRIEFWPDGFLDTTDKLLEQLFEVSQSSSGA